MRKRSRYRPRPISNPLRVISEHIPFDQREITQLAVPPRMAIEAIRYGKGTETDFDTLACIVNVCMVRTEQIGGDKTAALDVCYGAMEALMKMKERAQRLGKIGFGAGEMDALVPALDLHEQLIELSTPKQMADALRQVLSRIEAGHVQHDMRKTA
jgi:hypothetical protein